MKKFSVIIMAALLSVVSVFSAGCKDDENAVFQPAADETIKLSYGTGLDNAGNYNSNKFGFNTLEATGADPGVIYVSEDADPVYGGYYYSYTTTGSQWHHGWKIPLPEYYPSDVVECSVQVHRSKDLHVWETAGSEIETYGFSLIGKEDDWENWKAQSPWAPEVIYNASEQLYYMYYTTKAVSRDEGEIKADENTEDAERFYIGIAISETPVGPFYTLSATDETTGEKVPYINFQKAYGLEKNIGVIDVHPFLDDDGTFYLYFKAESGDEATCLYGMKMHSFCEPDYDSVTALAKPHYDTIKSSKGKKALTGEGIDLSESRTYEDGYLHEAPYMWKHNGKYYLTYSVNGYMDPAYSVWQAIGDSPLGQFTKVSKDVGNPILSGANLDYVKGTGHHSFVSNGTDMSIVYHVWTEPAALGWNRWLASDNCEFVATDSGQTIINVNGPSRSLEALKESISGYKNYAKDAVVSVSNGTGTEYLVDGVLPYYSYNEMNTFTTDKTVTVTLTFPEAVSIDSIMIHNAKDTEPAFSKIDQIVFELAETPTWAEGEYKYAIIEDLVFPDAYLDKNDDSYLLACAPAVAEFYEIKVKSIAITIDEADRLEPLGKLGGANTKLNVSEIVVLGR